MGRVATGQPRCAIISVAAWSPCRMVAELLVKFTFRPEALPNKARISLIAVVSSAVAWQKTMTSLV